jgi:cell division protein FtsB
MRKLGLYIVIIFQIILIVSLVRGIQLSLKSKERITALTTAKQKLEEEQKKLVDQQAYVQTPYYLEKVARDELHMSKPGETVVIVPDVSSQTSVVSGKEEVKKEKANWQKWWGVISGSD